MKKITANELRRLYIDFFVGKHDHAEIPSSSLIPENDPTVLFTTAGMHPLVPFLLGEAHPSGRRLVNVQKCIRTGDVDEVGDDTHLTFFEMLGNWSLGDYFKKDAIKMSFEFLTSSREASGLGLELERLAFTCFEGDKNAPRDEEAFNAWCELGVSEDRIAYLPKSENWWGPAGQTGPCGPDTEMFYWNSDKPVPTKFDPEDDTWVEIWNNVFMEYNKNEDGSYSELEQKNIDTGLGFERVFALMNGVRTAYETELFEEAVEAVRSLGGYDIGDAEPSDELVVSERVVCDHLRAATFILGDPMGVTPSNTDQGYVLRMLIRRAIRHGRKLGIEGEFVRKIAGIYVRYYGDAYPELIDNQEKIFEELVREEEQFGKTLEKGLREVEKCCSDDLLGGGFAFYMYETYGFPPEMTLEEIRKDSGLAGKLDEKKFWKEFEEALEAHKAKSRTGAEQKFSGGLADDSESVTRLHTATHLLHKALKQVLGDHVAQKGSNITSERLRFDFTHDEKMTPEQKEEVEKIVNEQIEADLPITCEEMTVEDAKKAGAIGLFESKYGDKVKVYTVGSKDAFSKEICGGPHVSGTGELGKFKIKKEESSSRGVRRIKAVLS
ncbi:alanine--tRNA ligase [Candidatus Peregrinibacteria bacterium]|mgnify:CR=1 FL=1|nr:alanine--tRNA ligase [Candidatus Peregrinibacteria bacterium]MBT4148655.1 alanine--tRNA ligase [Candidatus Peregrinibacteria bacterium]MBT4366339.1 alanine--tRNA ligase [Candidatus Peregrinibacteria bacterium]MBT4456014.1 alanine--tRNA ligase [Candidatus Peregrinibacteria bacterium]